MRITSINKSFEWSCYLLIVGLFFSRALLSISCILIFISATFLFLSQKVDFTRPSLKFLLFPLIYLTFILSYFNSTNINEWYDQIIKHSTLVLIPVGFLFMPKIEEKRRDRVTAFFSISGFICIVINTVSALFNSDIVKIASESQNVASLIGPSHSELGLLSAIGIIILCKLIHTYKSQILRIIIISILITWVVCLHIIAYRFALFTLYFTTFLFLIYQILRSYKKRKVLIAILLLVVTSLPVISYKIFPSVRARVNNSITDIMVIVENKNPNYHSLAQRWASIKCVGEIIKRNPIIGVSPSDLKQEMQIQYPKDSYLLIPENRVFIHNQLLFYAGAFGIPFTGLIIFLFSAVLLRELQWDFNFLWLILPFLLHMQIEITMEGQITSVAFMFVLFFCSKQSNKKYSVAV